MRVTPHREGGKLVPEPGSKAKLTKLGAAKCREDAGLNPAMAKQLAGRDLYRIDLSSVASKYIGETEKNIDRLFKAAADAGAVLLLDEAEAVLGKRTEAHDAHDRYANIEIDYLLQRAEKLGGTVTLTTNMKSALDPAFMRRLRFVVNFPYPGPSER
jgi:SpoVK/Ycf46/Vps4 family AAA+-type ATPase